MSLGSVEVAFRVFGENLDPDEITQELSIVPTASHRRGEAVRAPDGNVCSHHAKGSWRLDSMTKGSVSLDEHLRDLCERLTPSLVTLRGYSKRGFVMDFFIGIFGDDTAQNAFEISPVVIAMVEKIGATLAFNVYP